MSKFINPSDIKLTPADCFFGKRQVSTVTTVADSSGSLNDTYFLLSGFNSDYQEVDYYVWFNVNSAGTDPELPNQTGIEIAVATDATAAVVASAVKTAIDANANFSASVLDDVVTINHLHFGLCSLVDGASATGFDFEITTSGWGGKLGATSGGITVSFETATVDVTSDQTGAQVIEAIQNAANITVEMTLQEVTKEKWSLLVGRVAGDEITPVAGTKVIGMGESKRFKNMTQYAGELILIPVGAVDNSENHYFWQATPIVESVNFSGEEVMALPVSFRCWRDLTKKAAVNIWAFGDGSQDLSV